MAHRVSYGVLVCAVALVAAQRSSANNCSQHTFLGDLPNQGAELGWSEDAQGVTHDSDYWYFTHTSTRPGLWRIPVEHDLNHGVLCGHGGVTCNLLEDTELATHGYDHYGDPDFYQFNGRGYILVPIEGGVDGPGVAVFHADATLEYLAFAAFPQGAGEPVPGHSGWVTVDADGVVVSSVADPPTTRFDRFYVNWAMFQSTGEHELTLEKRPPMLLQDEAGAPLALFGFAQGGEFSDDGRLLYFLNGDRHDAIETMGLHVFQTRPGFGAECVSGVDPCTIARRIERSHNSSSPGFSFEFHPGCCDWQEPEGLTFWDLDADGRAPGIGGQLHAILLENEDLPVVGADDDVYMKHYRLADTDVDPPVITCPAEVVAECSSHSGLAATDPQLSSFFSGASATDVCDASPVLSNNAPAVFNLGTTPVTFTATDDSGNAASCQSPVTVVDTTRPQISVVLSPTTLWPPTHKLIRVTAAVTVADRCDSAVSFQLVSITSNEPDNDVGDGNTAGDIQDAALGTPDTSFLLRAERSGQGQERTYTVIYRATDDSGNVSDATAYVRVPHNR